MSKKQRPITKNEKETLLYIDGFIKSNGYPPTIREICEGVGITSSASGYARVMSLEKKGYIKRVPSKTRTLTVLNGAEE